MKENVQRALYWLKHLGDEFEYIATSPLQEKFKVMLLMVYVDIFSQIWWEYIKEEPDRGTQKERFASWSDEFIFCRNNKIFAKNMEEFYLLDGNVFYKIRNSLLHFGGLPNLHNVPVFITRDTRKEFYGKYPHILGKQEALVLCPRILSVAIAVAIGNTIEKIADQANNEEKQDSILMKIYERIQDESALPIVPENTRNL